MGCRDSFSLDALISALSAKKKTGQTNKENNVLLNINGPKGKYQYVDNTSKEITREPVVRLIRKGTFGTF